MDRLGDLKQTLPHNLAQARGFDVEWVILNYNSQDELATWAQQELSEEIENGRVLHAHEQDTDVFHMGRSRNMAFRIATGEFVFNVDADNFLPDGFIARLFEMMKEVPTRLAAARSSRLMHGLIGFWKHDLIEELGGYDETFFGYGLDDRDLIERAKKLDFGFRTIGGKPSKVERLGQTRHVKWINYKSKVHLRQMQEDNRDIMMANLKAGRFKANEGRPWGAGKLLVNFDKEVILS